MKRLLFAVPFFLNAVFSNCLGQELNQISDIESLEDFSLEALLEVSIATKSSRNLEEIPTIINVITKEQIRQRGYQNLGQLMNDLQDNNTDDYNWGIGEPTAQNVGFGFRFDTKQNMLFLFNGQRINAFLPGNTFGGEDYLLTNIQRVEIIRGPGSAIYGPNAFTSVINIITTSELAEKEDHFELGVFNSPTSLGNGFQSSFFTEVDGGILSAAIRYEKEKGQNLLIQNALFGNQTIRDGLLHAMDGNFSYSKNSFSIHGKFTNQSRNTLTGFNGVNPNEIDELTLDMYAYSVGASKDFNLSESVKLRFSAGWHQDNWTETALIPLFLTNADGSNLIYDTEGNPILDEISIFRNQAGGLVNTSFFIDGQGADTRTLDSELLLTYEANEVRRFTFGLNFIEDKVLHAYRPTELYLDPAIGFTPYSIVTDPSNNWLFDVNASRRTVGVFGQYEWDILPEVLFLNVGARFDQFSGTGVLSVQDYSEFNPKAGLVYRNEAIGNLKFVYGTATRVPNGFETLSSVAILGNPNNTPEHLRSFQFQWSRKLNKDIDAKIGLFHMSIDNKLETNADLSGELLAQGFVGQFVNLDSEVTANSSGLNGEVKATFGQIDACINFTQFLSTRGGDGNEIFYIPTTMINSNINIPTGMVNVNLGLNYRNEYSHPDEIDDRLPVKARLIANLNLTTNFERSDIDGFVTIRNLFNTKYNFPSSSQDFRQHFPARGLQLSVGINYRL